METDWFYTFSFQMHWYLINNFKNINDSSSHFWSFASILDDSSVYNQSLLANVIDGTNYLDSNFSTEKLQLIIARVIHLHADHFAYT